MWQRFESVTELMFLVYIAVIIYIIWALCRKCGSAGEGTERLNAGASYPSTLHVQTNFVQQIDTAASTCAVSESRPNETVITIASSETVEPSTPSIVDVPAAYDDLFPASKGCKVDDDPPPPYPGL